MVEASFLSMNLIAQAVLAFMVLMMLILLLSAICGSFMSGVVFWSKGEYLRFDRKFAFYWEAILFVLTVFFQDRGSDFLVVCVLQAEEGIVKEK